MIDKIGESLSRSLSFITDPRQPINFPYSYMHWHLLSRKLDDVKLKPKTELDLLFTIDLEYDYGAGGASTTRFVGPFLEKIRVLFSKHKLRSTIFIQGNLATKYAEQIRQIGAPETHEVGLHGYAHEPWGSSWFVKSDPPGQSERASLMKESLQAFTNAGIPKPKSFRAPNMVLDHYSMSLLSQSGFEVDSSFPSYMGGGNLVEKMRNNEINAGVTEIPVSSDPMPRFSRFGISHYSVFNTHNTVVKTLTGSGFSESVLRLAKFQILKGQKPFLVFLCHPWEFFNPIANISEREFSYSSENNIMLVSKAISSLEPYFTIRPVTMSELCKSIHNH